MGIPLNIDWQQILLHLFNFAILAGVLYLLLYKPIQDFIDKRKSYYEKEQNEALKLREEALALKEEYREKLDSLEGQIEKMREDAEHEIGLMRAQQLKQAHNEAELILERAKAVAKNEHDQMIKKYSAEIKDMAVSAAERAMLKSQGDPYEEFLHLAERSLYSEHTD